MTCCMASNHARHCFSVTPTFLTSLISTPARGNSLGTLTATSMLSSSTTKTTLTSLAFAATLTEKSSLSRSCWPTGEDGSRRASSSSEMSSGEKCREVKDWIVRDSWRFCSDDQYDRMMDGTACSAR